MFSKYLFHIAATIDIIALLIGVGMMVSDSLKGYSGTNNPTMFTAVAIVAGLTGAGFWLKSIGWLKLATTLVSIPAVPLGLYGVFVLLFIIINPDMK